MIVLLLYISFINIASTRFLICRKVSPPSPSSLPICTRCAASRSPRPSPSAPPILTLPPIFRTVSQLLTEAERTDAAPLHLMGIKFTYPRKIRYILPETGNAQSKVASFRERPDEATAQKYIDEGALWNSGFFAFRLATHSRRCRKSSPLTAMKTSATAMRSCQRSALTMPSPKKKKTSLSAATAAHGSTSAHGTPSQKSCSRRHRACHPRRDLLERPRRQYGVYAHPMHGSQKRRRRRPSSSPTNTAPA